MENATKKENMKKMEYEAPEIEIYDRPMYTLPEALIFTINQVINAHSQKAVLQANLA